MKSFFLIFLTALCINSAASECIQTKLEDISIGFEAFKTPNKVGVKGNLNDFSIKGDLKGNNIQKLTKGISVIINSKIVKSGNQGRDAKIAKFFFGKMKNHEIVATVKAINENYITLKIFMNGQTKDVPLKYEVKNNELTANGVIDIFDFDMHSSLKSLNQACRALHKGKTWNDVNLFLNVKFSSC